MAETKLNGYRLSPKAVSDLERIWHYSAQTWSVEQADRYIDSLASSFDVLVFHPELARERTEFNPPVRIHLHQKHLIIYTIAADHILIIRILGGGQDWHSILNILDSQTDHL